MKSYQDLLDMVGGSDLEQFIQDHMDKNDGALADSLEKLQRKNREVIRALEELEAPKEKIELAKTLESQGSDILFDLIQDVAREGRYVVVPEWFIQLTDIVLKSQGNELLKDIMQSQRGQ